jgi:hypothetical protein
MPGNGRRRDSVQSEQHGNTTSWHLQTELYNAKESFLDGGAMPAVLSHVRHTLEKVKIVLIDPA